MSLLVASIVGAVAGFGYFIYDLESSDMKGVMFRKDETGTKRFMPAGILAYLKSPFNSSILWKPRLLRSNWIVTMVSGAMLGAAIISGMHYLLRIFA